MIDDVRHTGEKTAILVDGGFYRRRAFYLFGDKDPKARADELVRYCCRHLRDGDRVNDLYRIFYYDARPVLENVYHPLLNRDVNIGKTDEYAWSMRFFEALDCMRKVAIRYGELDVANTAFRLTDKAHNKLFRGEIAFQDIDRSDFTLDIKQKGVDMLIGLDIASIAYKNQASQIVLISGDSDFVPAAKFARTEGVDFVLDPMWQPIRPQLNRHIDGLSSKTYSMPRPDVEKLHVDYEQPPLH